MQIACDPGPSISLIDSEIKQLNLAASLQQFPHNPCDKEETTHAALCPQKNSFLIRVVQERRSPPVPILLTAGLAGGWTHLASSVLLPQSEHCGNQAVKHWGV